MKLADQVEGGGFAFDAGVEGEDDLFDAFFIDAGEKLLDVELVRADAIHWTDDTAENVVEAFPGSAVFDGNDVTGFFNDADAVFVALAAFADRAELFVGEIEAAFAVMDAVAAVGDGIGEGVGDFLRLLQQMIGETLSAAGG